jgi:hypothetical protein
MAVALAARFPGVSREESRSVGPIAVAGPFAAGDRALSLALYSLWQIAGQLSVLRVDQRRSTAAPLGSGTSSSGMHLRVRLSFANGRC